MLIEEEWKDVPYDGTTTLMVSSDWIEFPDQNRATPGRGVSQKT